MKKSFLLLVLVLLVLTAAGCATSPNEGKRVAPEIGAVAPFFTLKDISGEKVSLSDQRGKVVLLNFWATWCPPCRQEMPGILSRYEQHQGDLVVLAIDADESANLVQEFAETIGLSFDPLLDPGAKIQSLYRITGYPTSMFVDENGVIQIIHVGFMSETQLDSYLTQMGVGESGTGE